MNPTPQQLRSQAFVNQNTPTPQNNQPNFIEKLLPTAGGILGGIGGEALDVFGGGIGGAAAGDAAGKALENALTGQSATKGVLTSAIEGGAGQGVGGLIGGAAKGVLGNVVAPLAEKGTNAMVAGQAAKGLIGPDLAQELAQTHGITDLSQAGKLANVLTGSSDSEDGKALINKAVENGINKYGPERVDVSDYSMPPATPKNAQGAAQVAQNSGNMVQDAVSRNYLTNNEANGVRARVSAITNALPKSISGSTDSTSALNLQRQLANEAASNRAAYIKSGMSDNSAKNLMGTYQDLSDNLRDRIFAPGGQDIAVPQEEKNALSSEIQQHAGPINQKAADAVSSQVQDAKTYSDLRAIQAKWVTANQAINKTDQMAALNFGTSTRDLAQAGLPIVGAIAGGPKGAVAGLAGAAMGNKAVDKTAASVLSNVATGAKGKIAQQILPRLIKATSIAGSNLPNDVSAPAAQTGTQPINANMDTTMNASPVNSAFNSLLGQEQAGAGLTPNAGALIAAIQALAPQVQKNNVAGLTASLEPSLLQNAGGPQGPLGGALTRITGLIPGTAANALQNSQNTAAATLGAALGISPGAARGILPTLTQNTGTAGQNQGVLQAILSQLGYSSLQPLGLQ